jgi:putative oxidoreductase
LIGLLTPIAAFGVACVMAVAILAVHGSNGLFAQDNGFEYPLTLFATAVFFLLRGPGPLSADALMRRASRTRGVDSSSRQLSPAKQQASR